MCIIIAKNKVGRLPSETELMNSFENNNDGAGFMYVDNGKVVIDKGYMNYEGFIKHYRTLLDKYNNFKNKSLVIHCRIGTSGKNNKGNTHPYPITDKVKLLRTRHLSRESIGIAHNGIIHGYGTATGLNDTQEYISKFLYPLYFHYRDFYKNKDMLYQMEQATNSKFAILDKTDDIYLVGNFIEDKGLYFSNNTYKDYGGYFKYDSKYYDDYYDDYYRDEENNWFNKLKQREEEQEETKKLSYTENEYDDFHLYKLESNWLVDMYGNGNYEKVGSRDYYYDWGTLELLEKINGDYKLVGNNPIVCDENGEEIF